MFFYLANYFLVEKIQLVRIEMGMTKVRWEAQIHLLHLHI